jgi:polyisoprenoid-binding protein YceI
MKLPILPAMTVAAVLAFTGVSVVRADDYTIDPAHSGVTFQISHLELSWTHGRFNDFSGGFSVDLKEPSKSSFTLAIKPESVDTNNAKRDEHLKSPDFFNTKQFPAIEFKSTSAKPVEGGIEVTGNLTLHGVTKPVTFVLKGGVKGEFPKGVYRTGFSTQFPIKRSNWGMDKMAPGISDEVWVAISFEGIKK